MQESVSSQNWFYEENGEKKGPFKSEEIIQFILNGTIKIESKIFDPATQTWKIAAEIIPLLDIPTHWQPPPRPPLLQDIHIVDLNAEHPENIDYFALVRNREAEQERTQIENLSKLQAISSHTTSGEKSIDKVLEDIKPDEWSYKIKEFFKQNQRIFSYGIASLGFVLATYGLFRTLSVKETAREPATTQILQKASQSILPTTQDKFGQGVNAVSRQTGGVSSHTTAAVPVVRPAIPNPPQQYSPEQVQAEISQQPIQHDQNENHYNSGEGFRSDSSDNNVASAQKLENPTENLQTPNQPIPNPNQDPNAGVVQPPEYIPQPDQY